MRFSRSLTVLLFLPVAACNGAQGPLDAGPQTDAGPATDAGSDAGPLLPPGTSSLILADAGLDAGLSLPPGTSALALNLGPLPVTAGNQIVYCNYMHLANEAPVEVIGYTSFQTVGGHHLILTLNNTDHPDSTQPWVCGQNEAIDPRNGAMLYVSQLLTDAQIFPPGVGMTLPPHASVMFQVHYIDATASDLEVSSGITLYVGAPGAVTTQAAPLILYDKTLLVPPGMSSATANCTVQTPAPMEIFMLAGHMHSHGTNFTLNYTGLDGGTSQIYQTGSWDSPTEKIFRPPLLAPPGSNFSWTCDYQNDTTSTISQPNEMCVVLGNYYPATQGSLFCEASFLGCVCSNGTYPDAG